MKEGAFVGHRGDEEYKIMDDKAVVDYFYNNKDAATEDLVKGFLSNETFFGQDLTKELDTLNTVVDYVKEIKANGMRATMEKYFG